MQMQAANKIRNFIDQKAHRDVFIYVILNRNATKFDRTLVFI